MKNFYILKWKMNKDEEREKMIKNHFSDHNSQQFFFRVFLSLSFYVFLVLSAILLFLFLPSSNFSDNFPSIYF